MAGATKVSVWSDGAAKHFKQGRTITFVCREWLDNATTVDYNFFASYHGKGSLFCFVLFFVFCFLFFFADQSLDRCDRSMRRARRPRQKHAATRGATRAAGDGSCWTRRTSQSTPRHDSELLATDDDNNADDDWVTGFDALRSQHHIVKSDVRDNVLITERSTNDALLVLKQSQLPSAPPNSHRCSNCFEGGHQISTYTRMFHLSEEEEEAALLSQLSIGMAPDAVDDDDDDNDDDDDDDDEPSAFKAARRIGRQQRAHVDAESRRMIRLDNQGRRTNTSH
jgi:hypothetical protein